MSELIMREVVCATADCGNEGIPIELILPADIAFAICGACETQIHDVTPPLDQSPAD